MHELYPKGSSSSSSTPRLESTVSVNGARRASRSIQGIPRCWPAALTFYGMIGFTFLRLRRVQKLARAPVYKFYALAIQAAFVAFVVGSMTLNLIYYELVFHLIAISVPLEVLLGEESEAKEREEMVPKGLVPVPRPAVGWSSATTGRMGTS